MPSLDKKLFDHSGITAIYKALGNSSDGLTHCEIGLLLQHVNIPDGSPGTSKRRRLYDAFCNKQNGSGSSTHILEFIRQAMKPANFIGRTDKYETLRVDLNRALAFSGLEIKETGELTTCNKIFTLTEAKLREDQFKTTLIKRNIHPDVLKFCSAELLEKNFLFFEYLASYFKSPSILKSYFEYQF